MTKAALGTSQVKNEDNLQKNASDGAEVITAPAAGGTDKDDAPVPVTTKGATKSKKQLIRQQQEQQQQFNSQMSVVMPQNSPTVSNARGKGGRLFDSRQQSRQGGGGHHAGGTAGLSFQSRHSQQPNVMRSQQSSVYSAAEYASSQCLEVVGRQIERQYTQVQYFFSEVVGSSHRTYLGMPVESENNNTVARINNNSKKQQQLQQQQMQPASSMQRQRLQNQLKNLNDQIELEIQQYQEDKQQENVTHKPLRMRALQEQRQKIIQQPIEKPCKQKKTDLLQNLNLWHRERMNNAMINQNQLLEFFQDRGLNQNQLKSTTLGKLPMHRQKFELQPVSGGLQIIRQVLPGQQQYTSHSVPPNGINQQPQMGSDDFGSLTNRALDPTPRRHYNQNQQPVTVNSVATGRSTRQSVGGGSGSPDIAANTTADNDKTKNDAQNMPPQHELQHRSTGEMLKDMRTAERKQAAKIKLAVTQLQYQQQQQLSHSPVTPGTALLQPQSFQIYGMPNSQSRQGESPIKTQKPHLNQSQQLANSQHPQNSIIYQIGSSGANNNTTNTGGLAQHFHQQMLLQGGEGGVINDDQRNQLNHSYQLGTNLSGTTPVNFPNAPLIQAAQPMRSYLQSQAVPRRGQSNPFGAALSGYQSKIDQKEHQQTLRQSQKHPKNYKNINQLAQRTSPISIGGGEPFSSQNSAIGAKSIRFERVTTAALATPEGKSSKDPALATNTLLMSSNGGKAGGDGSSKMRMNQTQEAFMNKNKHVIRSNNNHMAARDHIRSKKAVAGFSGEMMLMQNQKYPSGNRHQQASAYHQTASPKKKEYLPSVNRMLVDLKKLDYFSDPNSVLFNLRTTLEECSQKQRKDSLTKLKKISMREPASRLSNCNNNEASSTGFGGGSRKQYHQNASFQMQTILRSDRSQQNSSPSRRTSLVDSASQNNYYINNGSNNNQVSCCLKCPQQPPQLLNSKSQVDEGDQQNFYNINKVQVPNQLQSSCINCKCNCHYFQVPLGPANQPQSVNLHRISSTLQQFYQMQTAAAATNQSAQMAAALASRTTTTASPQGQGQNNLLSAMVQRITNNKNHQALGGVAVSPALISSTTTTQQVIVPSINLQLQTNNEDLANNLGRSVSTAARRDNDYYEASSTEHPRALHHQRILTDYNNSTVDMQLASSRGENTARLPFDENNTVSSCIQSQNSSSKVPEVASHQEEEQQPKQQENKTNQSQNDSAIAIVNRDLATPLVKTGGGLRESSEKQNFAAESMLSLSQPHGSRLEGGKYQQQRDSQLDEENKGEQRSPNKIQVIQRTSVGAVIEAGINAALPFDSGAQNQQQLIESGEVDQRAGQNVSNNQERKVVYVPLNNSNGSLNQYECSSNGTGNDGRQNQLIQSFGGGASLAQQAIMLSQQQAQVQQQNLPVQSKILPNQLVLDITSAKCQTTRARDQQPATMQQMPLHFDSNLNMQQVGGMIQAPSLNLNSNRASSLGHHNERSITCQDYERIEGWANAINTDDYGLEEERSGMDLGSARSIKEHHSRIQMDYYEEPRQYNALEMDTCKYPTRTNLIEGQSQTGILRFGDLRERPNIDVGSMAYHDQKEFFRLDREHDQVLIGQHEWKTKKTINQVEKALNANLNRERINIFKCFLNDSKRQSIKMNNLCMSSCIPRIALTDKTAAFQPNKFISTTEKVMRQPIAFRQDIAESVAKRFNNTALDEAACKTDSYPEMMVNSNPVYDQMRSSLRDSMNALFKQYSSSSGKKHQLEKGNRSYPASQNVSPLNTQQHHPQQRWNTGASASRHHVVGWQQRTGGERISNTGAMATRGSRTPKNARNKIYKGIPSRQRNGTVNPTLRSGFVVNSG